METILKFRIVNIYVPKTFICRNFIFFIFSWHISYFMYFQSQDQLGIAWAERIEDSRDNELCTVTWEFQVSLALASPYIFLWVLLLGSQVVLALNSIQGP